MPFRKDYFQQKKNEMILLLILNITLLNESPNTF